MPARPLIAISVPSGPDGLTALIGPLRAALGGTGPAITPIPAQSPEISPQYLALLLAATRPDDESQPLEDDEVAVVLATSGSTQNPKGVLHSAATLSALSASVQGGSTPQWIAALPITSMGGMNVVLRALETGLDPLSIDSLGGARPFTPAGFISVVQRAAQRSTDVRVSLVAAQVRRLLSDPAGVNALLQCSQILVGGGPLPAVTADAARVAGVSLTTTYGATETAGGAVFNSQPLSGVTISIDPASSEISLAGDMVALGYRCAPELTEQRFVQGSYRTGDLGTFTDHLTITGRIDDVTTINGVNVALHAIEEILNNCEGVLAAAVVAAPDLGDEDQVFAIIQPTRDFDHESLCLDLRNAVHLALGKAAAPRYFAFLTAIPMLPNNKVDRQSIMQLTRDGALWQR
jgi:O-succinylbenzoic acid--CoA ligase